MKTKVKVKRGKGLWGNPILARNSVFGGFTVSGPDTEWAREALKINDDPDCTDAEQERRLLEHCERDDSPFEIEFVD